MELIVYAPVWGQSGMEQLSRNLLIALDQVGVNIELRTDDTWNMERIALDGATFSRLERMTKTRVSPIAPHVICQVPKGQPVTEDAPTICYTLFETDRCPTPWINSLNQLDKVMVFTEFNREAWARTGIQEQKLGVIPPGVDSFIFTPDGPKLEIKNKKGFTFLCSGDFTERKNFEAVIEAFTKEFDSSSPVTLIFKCHYGGFTKKYRMECLKRLREIAMNFNAENAPRILFWGDKISEWAMAALYRSVDCFVLTSRGEGIGMQYLEAMASGTPVIACDWGGQTDFLNHENSYPVKSHLKIIDDVNYIIKCPQALNSQWCQVEIDELRNAMRSVMDDYPLAKQKTEIALRQVREMTWQRAAIEFIRQVINMYDRKPVEVMA